MKGEIVPYTVGPLNKIRAFVSAVRKFKGGCSRAMRPIGFSLTLTSPCRGKVRNNSGSIITLHRKTSRISILVQSLHIRNHVRPIAPISYQLKLANEEKLKASHPPCSFPRCVLPCDLLALHHYLYPFRCPIKSPICIHAKCVQAL